MNARRAGTSAAHVVALGLVAALTALGLALVTGQFRAQGTALAARGQESTATSSTVAGASTTAPASTTTTRPAGPIRLYIAGDSTAGGLGTGLQPLVKAQGIDSTLDYKVSTGLTRPDFYDWPARLRDQVPQVHPDVVVVMFGGNDAQDIKLPDGRSVPMTKPEWAQEYGRRVGETMDYLAGEGRTLIWVGVPSAESAEFNSRLSILRNVLIDQAKSRPNVVFVDPWPVFNGPDGTFAQYVVDDDGLAKPMRAQDGYHLNLTGAKKLAVLVDAEVLKAATAHGGTVTGAPPTTVAPPDGGSGYYKVQAGDAWGLIASRLGTTLQRLLDANGAKPDGVIVPDQKLKVPAPQTP